MAITSEKFFMQGLGGKRALHGSIPVYGAKNQALKALAASILYETPLILENVPAIEDVGRMVEILEYIGVQVERRDRHAYALTPQKTGNPDVPEELGKRLRASVVLSGPLLARFGRASFPHPGGDLIGERPIDIFLEGFRAMGASVKEGKDGYTLSAPRGLHGADIFFRLVSVTGTETLMMAATLANGRTTLRNAAMEPEITALAEMLRASGVRIEGAGTSTIYIEGGKRLRATKAFRMIPDRIEAGSFVLLASVLGKGVRVEACLPEHLSILLTLLKRAGVPLKVTKNAIEVGAAKHIKGFNIKTHEYPGFPTDLQAPSVVFLTQVSGESHVFETIFDGRLSYVPELKSMGADISEWNPHEVTIKGPTPLRGRELKSPDIRAGLAFLMAGAIASGESRIDDVFHIDRGYESVEKRLAPLGLHIERMR